MSLNLPMLPLWVDDFVGGTSTLEAESVGSYLRLLIEQWKRGPLPKSEKKLARIAGVDRSDWPEIWSEIGDKFVETDEGLISTKLEEVRESVVSRSKKAREAGRKGARKRWHGGANGSPKGGANGDPKGGANGIATENDGILNPKSQSPKQQTSHSQSEEEREGASREPEQGVRELRPPCGSGWLDSAHKALAESGCNIRTVDYARIRKDYADAFTKENVADWISSAANVVDGIGFPFDWLRKRAKRALEDDSTEGGEKKLEGWQIDKELTRIEKTARELWDLKDFSNPASRKRHSEDWERYQRMKKRIEELKKQL